MHPYQHFITLHGEYLFLDSPIIMIDRLKYEFKCHLAGLDENNFPLVWKSGCTSWSVEEHTNQHFIPSGGWYAYRFDGDINLKLNYTAPL